MGRGRPGVFNGTFALRRVLAQAIAGIAAALTCHLGATPAFADEGGVSLWVPGFFGSLAATPQQPGFTFSTIYYHTSVTAGADVAFARQVHRGNINVPFTGNVDISLKAKADLAMAVGSYVFATPVLGAQAPICNSLQFFENVSIAVIPTANDDRPYTARIEALRRTRSASSKTSDSGVA